MRAPVSRMPPRTILGFQFLELFSQNGRFRRFAFGRIGDQRLDNLGLCRVDGVLAFGLGGNLVGSRQIFSCQGLDLVKQCRMVRYGQFTRFLRRGFRKLDDRVDHRLKALVTKHHRTEHDVFVQFLGFRLDHQNGIAGSGNHQIKLGFRHVVNQRGSVHIRR